MSLEHDILRKLPLSKLGADLDCAVIDHDCDEERYQVACRLIDLAQAMAEHLSPVDRRICAVVMYKAFISLLQPEPSKADGAAERKTD